MLYFLSCMLCIKETQLWDSTLHRVTKSQITEGNFSGVNLYL